MNVLARSSLVFLCLASCAVDPGDQVDPTTTSAAAIEDVVDIADRLAAVPGVELVELAPPAAGFRHFNLTFVQPVDHRRPHGATFTQRLNLVHHDEARPLVFNTEGYDIEPSFPAYGFLARSLTGNRLTVEHRYFGESTPSSADFRFLTIDQAAADHHRIVEALRPVYTGAWISTGASKGGMTATFHRRRYPNDVDGTVADVAPITYGMRDLRYIPFVARLGDDACRAQMHAYQRAVLARRDALVPVVDALAAERGDAFTMLPGGTAQAIDIAVGELWFQFWQYGDTTYCAYIPAADAPDDELVWLLDAFDLFATASDLALTQYGPYYYQSVTQLGSPRLPTAHLRDLLAHDPNDYEPYVAAYGPRPSLDLWPMIDISIWSLFQSTKVMYVYGENDPWTAGAYPVLPGGRRDVHRFTVGAGNHGASFRRLAPADQALFLERLGAWTGVTPVAPPPPPPPSARATDAWMEQEPTPRIRRPL